MRRCPTCGSTQKKHDDIACEEYEAWLSSREDDPVDWGDEDE